MLLFVFNFLCLFCNHKYWIRVITQNEFFWFGHVKNCPRKNMVSWSIFNLSWSKLYRLQIRTKSRLRIQITDPDYGSRLRTQITDLDYGSRLRIQNTDPDYWLRIRIYNQDNLVHYGLKIGQDLQYSYADNFSPDKIKFNNSALWPWFQMNEYLLPFMFRLFIDGRGGAS